MKRLSIHALLLCAAVAAPWALAQPGAGTAAPVVRHAAGGIDYMSGGAGQEDRDAMAAQQAGYTLKVIMSGHGGEYVVADSLRVQGAQGELLVVRDAGPIVMVKLPAGAYTIETTWHGTSERRKVSVGSGMQTVNWRFAG